MRQQFVIVQALGGKPLKRVVMTNADKGVLVADPGLLDEIGSGIHRPVTAPRESVFNFNEDVFDELVVQWHESKQTSAATWAKLDQFQPLLDSVD
jgi:hypothetical protein